MSGHHAAPEQVDPATLAERLAALIRDVPDYPRPGVAFKDLTPLFADADAFAETVEGLAAIVESGLGSAHGGRERIDMVAGIEARGFILAAPVSLALGAGFVPVRKRGKLPRTTHQVSYDLEYGSAEIEVHTDAFGVGQRVLVVDDVLATGGTAAATIDLVRAAGGEVVGVVVLLELGFLGGRELLAKHAPDVPTFALLSA